MSKIGVVFAYDKIKLIADELAVEQGHELIYDIGIYGETVEQSVRYLEENQVDAIIARGITGYEMKRYSKVPIINVDISNYDIARALKSAMLMGEKISFIDAVGNTNSYDIESIKNTLGIDFHHTSYHDLESANQAILDAKQNGIDVIVACGGCFVNKARNLGLNAVMVKTSRLTMENAFHRANNVIELFRQDKAKSMYIENIIDNSENGIITVNNHGEIDYINKKMDTFLKTDCHQFLGVNVISLCRDNSLFELIFSDGSKTSNQIIEIHHEQYSLSRELIHIDANNIGTVIYLNKVSDILDKERKIRKKIYLSGFNAKSNFYDIHTSSQIMESLIDKAKRYAATTSNILIYGESGTGKELFAQSIHNASPHKTGPFVAVNCASLPENLLESELFGYKEGAFSGARKGGKLGLFELAHDGTIFLDEIGEMSPSLQPRLLRVLQEKCVMPLGGDRIVPVNNRIICATNKDLYEQVKKGLFREDLYYRINTLELRLPPLRARTNDIVGTANVLAKKINLKLGRDVSFDSTLLDQLETYSWPGNIRQLESFIERVIVSTPGYHVSPEMFTMLLNELKGIEHKAIPLPSEYTSSNEDCLLPDNLNVYLGTMKDMEQQIIDQLYQHLNGDLKQLINVLGVSRSTLWRKLKKELQ